MRTMSWLRYLAAFASMAMPLAACGGDFSGDDDSVVEDDTLGEGQEALVNSCWQVTSPVHPFGSYLALAPVACTTVPLTTGWVQVSLYYSQPPNLPVWIRIPLTDPNISSAPPFYQFAPLLVFDGYSGSTPKVKIDALVGGYSNTMPLVPYPPNQGTPVVGAQVRLRNATDNKCVRTPTPNGGSAVNSACSNDPSQTFVLDDAGSGTFRLRNNQTSQCLYASASNGAPLYNWACWADPNMRFNLVPAANGYRLTHVNTSQCPYGNPTEGGVVHTWGCWADPHMEYYVDILAPTCGNGVCETGEDCCSCAADCGGLSCC